MSGADNGKCMSCGGMVDAEGYALGGLVEETGSEQTPAAVNSVGESTQMRGAEESERNAAKRFVRAVRGGR